MSGDGSREDGAPAAEHRYELAAGESACVAVVEAVADRHGVHPLQLPEVLNAAVDADALEHLVAARQRTASADGPLVGFEFCGYSVQVSDRWIYIIE